MATQDQELAGLRSNRTYSEEFIDHHFRQQFDWQDRHYRSNAYPNARFDLILYHGQPVGRFYVNRGSTDFRIIDIAILPEFRGLRIGEALIRELQQEATHSGALVSIHVEQTNPQGIAFYKRLGFTFTEATQRNRLHLYMEFQPKEAPRRLFLPGAS